MAVGILTIRGNQCDLEFKTQKGTHMGVPYRCPSWAEEGRYAVLLSVKEEDDFVSNLKILTYVEIY